MRSLSNPARIRKSGRVSVIAFFVSCPSSGHARPICQPWSAGTDGHGGCRHSDLQYTLQNIRFRWMVSPASRLARRDGTRTCRAGARLMCGRTAVRSRQDSPSVKFMAKPKLPLFHHPPRRAETRLSTASAEHPFVDTFRNGMR